MSSWLFIAYLLSFTPVDVLSNVVVGVVSRMMSGTVTNCLVCLLNILGVSLLKLCQPIINYNNQNEKLLELLEQLNFFSCNLNNWIFSVPKDHKFLSVWLSSYSKKPKSVWLLKMIATIDENLSLFSLKENNSEHVSPASLFNKLSQRTKIIQVQHIPTFKTSLCKSEIMVLRPFFFC